MLTREESLLLAEISGLRAFRHLAQLARGGERPAGSALEAETARRVRGALAPLVDRCEVEPFPAVTYLRGAGLLRVVDPVEVEVPCQVNPVAAGGEGEGPLVDLGPGLLEDFARCDVRGRVALASPEEWWACALEARRRGALALVFNRPSTRDDLVSVHGVNAPIPVLSVSNRGARLLRGLLSRHGGVRVRFRADLRAEEGTSGNVVGVLQGSSRPGEVVYLTAHHDTWFTGANDNLASVACLLEVARALSQRRPRRTVVFISFGGEESGSPAGEDPLYWDRGSTAYSLAHRESLCGGDPSHLPLAVLNAEVIGYTRHMEVQATAELLPLVRGCTADLGAPVLAREPQPVWRDSDHLCFHTLGVPSAVLWPAEGHGGPGLPSYWAIYHTPSDDLEAVDPLALEQNARLWALMAWRLASREEQPLSVQALASAVDRGLDLAGPGVRGRVLQALGRAVEPRPGRDPLRAVLAVARVANTTLYGCTETLVLHRFQRAAEACHKLGLVAQLASQGRLQRALEVLATIPTAAYYRMAGPETLADVLRCQGASPVLSRLSPFWLDLAPLWQALEAGDREGAVRLAGERREALRADVGQWALELAERLEALAEGQ